MDKLLNVQPKELSFPFQLKKQVSCSFRLSNTTEKHVGFKVMTTNPTKYCVQPNVGIVLPGSSCHVTVTMSGLKEAPPNMQCKDKFLIKSALASPVATAEDVHELFNSEVGDDVQKCKLGVIYSLPPQVPSPVAVRSTSVRKLLNVQPSELQFPFELKKELSCLLQLSNMTENHVGFKVKTTDPKKYCVQPNFGIVLPRSTCDVIVRMQPQTKIPLDRQCKDKFLIQSTIAPTSRKFTSEMFETGGVVEEFKLRVVYTFLPHPQPSDYQISEAYSTQNASTLSERNSNVTEVIQRLDTNESHVGDLFKKGITIGLLGLIFWYLLRKMLPLIWSLTFVIMMLIVKMIKSIVSDSVEDWIVKSLVFVCCHFLSKLFGGRWNITTS